MVDRRRRALRNASRAGSVTALLLPLLAAGPAATDQPLSLTGPSAPPAAVGSSTPLAGASINGMDAAEVVRVLVGVASGTISVPAAASAVTVPAGYPALGTEGPELALEGTQDALNGALAQLRWTPATAGPAAVTIDASPAGAAYDPANGHFYQVVTPTQALSWDAAKAAAAATTFEGETGYLATITDAREEATVAAVTSGAAWIGGNREGSSSDWAWATGPEAGTTFWTPACGAGAQGDCSAADPPTFSMWAPGEPRSFPDATVTTFLGGTGGGLWAPSTMSATPPSYVVEFGGLPGDAVPEVAHAEATLDATAPAGGITPLTPGPGATPIRSIPTTTTPATTAAPTTTALAELPTAAPPVTEPPPTEPPTTAPATTPPEETTTPAATAPAATTPPETTTTVAPTEDTTAAAPSAPSALPVYIVFDVGVGTPLADVRITVRGYTLQPGSPLTVEAHSAPATIATVPADASGTVVADVALPDVGDGEHTIVATGLGVNGAVYQRTTEFAVTNGILSRIGPPVAMPPTTPATSVPPAAVASPVTTEAALGGSSSGLPAPLILVLLAGVVGAIVWLVTRRRKGTPKAARPATAADRPRPAPPVLLDDHVDQFR